MPTKFTPLVTVSGSTVTVPSNPMPPQAPSGFIPGSEERFVSFVLEIDNEARDADIKALTPKLNEIFSTKLSGYFPELFYAKSTVWNSLKQFEKDKKPLTQEIYLGNVDLLKRLDKIKQKNYSELPYRLERLFPGSENDFKNAKTFGLHKFLLLKLPVYEKVFKTKTTDKEFISVMFEISKELRNFCKLPTVKPALQYPDYQLLSTPCGCTNFNVDDWPLERIKAKQLPNGIDGRDILIGHIDTGWTRHSQLNFNSGTSPNYDFARDWNVLTGENSAEEPLDFQFAIRNPFHGTATGSLIISNDNDSSPGGMQDTAISSSAPIKKVRGVAVGAKLVPIRCTDTVVLIGDVDIARSVWYATTQNVDVISMSLGGYPAPELECVVAHAVYNNIITVAAAGNYYPLVVYPAAYEECIAVGGSHSF